MPKINDFNDTQYLKQSEVQNGDIVTFKDAGKYVSDRWGEGKLQMDILLPNGQTRRITVNKTSQRNLSRAYGEDTSEWVGKKAIIRKEEIHIGGEAVQALVLYPFTSW